VGAQKTELKKVWPEGRRSNPSEAAARSKRKPPTKEKPSDNGVQTSLRKPEVLQKVFRLKLEKADNMRTSPPCGGGGIKRGIQKRLLYALYKRAVGTSSTT